MDEEWEKERGPKPITRNNIAGHDTETMQKMIIYGDWILIMQNFNIHA